MSAKHKLSGAALATAAAGLFLTGCQSMDYSKDASSKTAEVQCHGVNSCKGTSACATASSSCKGHNSCKGSGWLPMSKEDCDEKGGTVKG
jgi:hypothetical protein